jgi:hypothetical protein
VVKKIIEPLLPDDVEHSPNVGLTGRDVVASVLTLVG